MSGVAWSGVVCIKDCLYIVLCVQYICFCMVDVLRYRKAALCLGGGDVISSPDEPHHVFPLPGR